RRRARRLHRRLRVLPRGRRRDAALQGPARRSLPEPALGLRRQRPRHVPLRRPRRDVRGRRRVLRPSGTRPGGGCRHRDRRVQPLRGVRSHDGGRGAEPRRARVTVAVPEALRERSFRLLFAARTASFFGTNLAPIAVAFAVLGLTGSATWVGLSFAAWTLAQISTLLVGGIVADRLPRRRLVVGSDTCP